MCINGWYYIEKKIKTWNQQAQAYFLIKCGLGLKSTSKGLAVLSKGKQLGPNTLCCKLICSL